MLRNKDDDRYTGVGTLYVGRETMHSPGCGYIEIHMNVCIENNEASSNYVRDALYENGTYYSLYTANKELRLHFYARDRHSMLEILDMLVAKEVNLLAHRNAIQNQRPSFSEWYDLPRHCGTSIKEENLSKQPKYSKGDKVWYQEWKKLVTLHHKPKRNKIGEIIYQLETNGTGDQVYLTDDSINGGTFHGAVLECDLFIP